MPQRIDRDLRRFEKIVRGKVKTDLGKYISHPELIGKKGKDLISIPLPQIDIPKFRFADKGSGGVGQGDGDAGQPLGPAQGEGESGAGSGGGGKHTLEVELTYDELAEILGEKLNLPNLKPKEQGQIEEHKDKYTGIRTTGPESLRHYKRTFKRALAREISQGTYDPANPKIIPIKEDKRYKAGKPTPKPETIADIYYIMDVSGSITDEMKEIIRTELWWINLWIKHHHKNAGELYIIHDDKAEKVDNHTFYHTTTSGGTKISSAIALTNQIINPNSNNYVIYRGDGDNATEDNPNTVQGIKELLPKVNLFSYGEVGPERTTYYSGYMGMGGMSTKAKTFYDEMANHFKDEIGKGTIRVTKTPNKDKILDSIRATFEARQQLATASDEVVY